MSDIAAAAAALGLPEVLVQRSAEARAAETGANVDEILTAWAGGAAPPAPTSEEATVETTLPAEPETAEEPAVSEAAIVVPTQAVAVAAPAEAGPAGPYKPPILVGSRDNPMTVIFGAVALFVMVALVGLVGPSLQAETPGARSSDLPYTGLAVEGQVSYASLGCAACHTQMVRPVIADVGLGAVTLNDSNQILGTRRFGPDLSNVGSRLNDEQLQATVEGQIAGHPAYTLSTRDMSSLVAYLSQSITAEGDG